MGGFLPITMKDIARELGVSVATVSRALKDSPRISKEQRERVQTYAREHGFSPNVIGEALRHSKVMPMKVIGVIIPQFAHYYFSTVLSGIEEEASARGYRIMVAQSNERYEREMAICESYYKNKVCGIIVSQAKDTTKYAHFQHLIDNGVPLVFYDRICTGVDCSRVVVDDYMGAYTAVTHLIDTGCKRIAYYGASMKLEIAKNRFNGYKDALLRHGMPVDEHLVRLCDNRTAAEAITPDLMELDNRPDAFFAVNDDTAIGIMYTVRRGLQCAGRHQRVRVHQRATRRGLRPASHHRRAAGQTGGRRGCQHSDRSRGRLYPHGPGGETRGEDTPDCAWHNKVARCKI